MSLKPQTPKILTEKTGKAVNSIKTKKLEIHFPQTIISPIRVVQVEGMKKVTLIVKRKRKEIGRDY